MSLESLERTSSESLLNLISSLDGRAAGNRSSMGQFLSGMENNLRSAGRCRKKHGLSRCFSSSEYLIKRYAKTGAASKGSGPGFFLCVLYSSSNAPV